MRRMATLAVAAVTALAVTAVPASAGSDDSVVDVAVAAFEHHRLDALLVQQVGQQQPGRSGTDDRDLGTHDTSLAHRRAPACAAFRPAETAHAVGQCFVALRTARAYSRFRLTMLKNGISFGHVATHSPLFVHPPKPSASIVATMSSTRDSRSGWP